MPYCLREFKPSDAAAINAVALSAFGELRHHYNDWDMFSRNVGNMASLAQNGELIVATADGSVVGAAAYVGPQKEKAEFFSVEWPILRMLVVTPTYRGLGIGRALTEACIHRAERDRAPLIALHTTPIMRVALSMYERMGFKYQHDAPAIFGVPYAIYAKPLTSPRARTNRRKNNGG